MFSANPKSAQFASIALIMLLAACGTSNDANQAQTDENIADESAASTQVTAQSIEAAPTADLANLEAPYNEADFANGKSKYNQCVACHAVQDGRNGLGPHLHNIIGRKAGSIEGYQYSDALINSDKIWDAATLDAWIENSAKIIPGTKMNYAGMRSADDRRDVIAYLMVETKK